ncbi:MAG: 4-hydroxy-tetrahydrodipicolinate reductase, partial [Planctomycetes bacterium SM23_32]
MRVAVNGAAGAMGRQVIGAVARSGDCQLVAALERSDHPDLGKDAGLLAGVGPLGVALSAELAGEPDVLVDFSAPESAVSRARQCAARGVALVIGTTGLSDQQTAVIEQEAAARVPVLVAPNMSLGVNLLFQLAEQAALALGGGFDVEIVEAHHRRKKDAPSGTAMELSRRLCAALGRDADSDVRHGRRGAVGPRAPEEIGIHAVRGGDIVGDHTVIFAGEGERL